MSALHYDKKEHLRTEMNSYSNDVYEKVPFTLDPKTAALPDADIKNRICSGVYKRFKPSHFGGCGYSCTVAEFHREPGARTGHVVLMHYHGIGD